MVIGSDIIEKAQDIDFLLEERADLVVVGMAGDGQNRGVVELGVVEAVQEMDRAGPAGGEAHAQAPVNLAYPQAANAAASS